MKLLRNARSLWASKIRAIGTGLRVAATSSRARALDLIYPGFCRECGKAAPGPEPFCAPCAGLIRWIATACPRCGEPAVHPGPESCGSCSGRVLFFDRAAAPCEYRGPWRTALLRFKYQGDSGVRDTLCSAMETVVRQKFSSPPPGLIVPVPAHPWRKWIRGRDPVEELAVGLSRRIAVPIRQVLRRSKWIPSQTSLLRERRIRNPRGAYQVRRKFRSGRFRPQGSIPGSVLLLDDVLTTGATVSECARALKQAGARVVVVLAAARSPA